MEAQKQPVKNLILTPALENYIKTIFVLTAGKREVRVKNIAKLHGCSMPTVSSALKRLSSLDLIEYEKYDYIELTPLGRKVGRVMMKKYECLKDFFEIVLNIRNNSVKQLSCSMEHVLTPEVYEKLKKLIRFYESEKAHRNEWVSRLVKTLTEK